MLLSQEMIQKTALGAKVNEQCLTYPERILQIGEGNFLRAFADWVIHRLNETNRFKGRIVIAAPRSQGHQNIEQINAQDGLYTVWLRGVQNGKIVDAPEVITSVSRGIDPSIEWDKFLQCAESEEIRIVISNTTESGLVYKPEKFEPMKPLETFPARLTAYLYHRFNKFSGTEVSGMTMIPCELVEGNGTLLREIVLHHAADWQLPEAFSSWVRTKNRFCNTLVDRIVTGKPKDLSGTDIEQRLGYRDQLVSVAEPFYLWVIQGDDRLQDVLQITEDDTLNVHIVDDVTPFQLKKVRILNGAHTAMSAVAHFASIQTVGQVMEDEVVAGFIRDLVADEIVPSLGRHGISHAEAASFVEAVWERFSNPFLHHQISSLALNGLSKVGSRLLPTITDYVEIFGTAPALISVSLGALLLYYKNADSPKEQWPIQDDPTLLNQLQGAWKKFDGNNIEAIVMELLGSEQVWGTDLAKVPQLAERVSAAVNGIRTLGMKEYLQQLRLPRKE